MAGFAWLAMRQAQEAMKHSRLEEALRLLNQPHAQEHRNAAGLTTKLARAFTTRAERSLRKDDAEAAWRDLLQAEQLQPHEKNAERLRGALTRLGVAEVRALLQAGEPGRAEESAARLRGKLVRTPELQVLEDAAHSWLSARDLAARGEFAQALEAVERVGRLAPAVRVLAEYRKDLEHRQQEFAGLLVALHEAAGAGRGGDVIQAAEQVLAVAPQHTEARKARGHAWKVIEPVTIAHVAAAPTPPTAAPAAPTGLPDRFLLWIDGVGGYLVCLGVRVNFGQAAPGSAVDVPLVADVSRMHATLTRDGEGYVVEATRAVAVNGKPTTRALLRPGDRVTLGASCQLRFRQPAPPSATARLDLVSGHRLPLGVDGIVVMAETLILGAGSQVHVPVPDMKEPVVFFRHKDGLGLRHAGGLTVNGQKVPERTVLGPRAQVCGDDFAFAVEPTETQRG
ncbi:MAG TPA: FHA domain-containing protein, partial [Gemmataceae bacterium]|nr:FHA domain-containing protein [Gemmataceae bacterium]